MSAKEDLLRFGNLAIAAMDATGSPSATQIGVIDALDVEKRHTVGKLESFEGGGLFLSGGADPSCVLKLGDRLITASAANAGGPLVDDNDTRDAIFAIVKAARAAKEADDKKAAAAEKAASGGAGNVVGIYEEARKWFGLNPKNSDKATFVPDARKQFTEHGHITELPSIAKVRTLGTAGGTKRRLSLPGATEEEEATLTLNEARPKVITGLPDAKNNVRILLNGLLAVVAYPLGPAGYGGRDSGYANVPGQVDQYRFFLTREGKDRLEWEINGSPLEDVDAFTRMADNVLATFIDDAANMTNTGDELVETYIATRQRLFTADPGVGPTEAREAAAKDLPANSHAGGAKTECVSWLINGACNEAGCRAPHVASRQGALHGGGGAGRGQRIRGAGSNKGNNNGGWGPWGGGTRSRIQPVTRVGGLTGVARQGEPAVRVTPPACQPRGTPRVLTLRPPLDRRCARMWAAAEATDSLGRMWADECGGALFVCEDGRRLPRGPRVHADVTLAHAWDVGGRHHCTGSVWCLWPDGLSL